MPVPLDPGDRKLLVGAGLLLGLMTAAGLLLDPGGQAPSRSHSSYSTAVDGAKAAYLLLGELGYQVERWERPPADLPPQPENTLLLLADPFLPASAEQKRNIRAFIWNGGRVLATGPTGAGLLPQAGVRENHRRRLPSEKSLAQLPGPITRQAPEIALPSRVRWSEKHLTHLPYYADSEGATVVSYRLGTGQVVWWAGAGPLTNSGLMQAHNLVLLLNSVGAPKHTRVLWDEYFHGQRPGLIYYLGRTPAPWLLAQLLLVAVAVLLTYSRRSEPVRALDTGGSRLSPLEFIETLGDLYHRKGAAREAVEIAYHRFRFLLLRRLGLPSAATVDQIWSGARDRLGWRDPGVLKTLERCERGMKTGELSEPAALRLIGELHDHARRGRLTGKFRED